MVSTDLGDMGVLEQSEIQRLILGGYVRCPFGYTILLSVVDGAKARRWLRKVLEKVSYGDADSHEPQRMNIAFTSQGLATLGVELDRFEGFSEEFLEGARTERRLRFNGDVGTSSPHYWRWGADGQPTVDILLLLYGSTTKRRGLLARQVLGNLAENGLELVQSVEANLRPDRREAFGFVDGLVQPCIAGHRFEGDPRNRVAAGEFILGYPNEREGFTASPVILPSGGAEEMLPGSVAFPGMRDFGRNGTYVVYRQLMQHVARFWSFVEDSAKQAGSAHFTGEMVAAKMMGRWRNGVALVKSPERDDEEAREKVGEYFSYREEDKDGFRCPVGAHIRRSNPRDSLSPNAVSSTKFTNLHRIIRRGRSYELGPGTAPEEIDGREKGLHFIGINTSIANQFEFIQHDWLNNPKFEPGLEADADPIVGAQDPKHPERTNQFTIQDEPVKRKICGLQRFVDVVGSGYFFMPSRSAMRYLQTLE